MIIDKDAASLEARVYAALEDAILSGELKKGEALTELSISEKLGVSRTPVRSALHRLAEEGLIEALPNRGAVVVGVTTDDLVDIYRIRMRLEGLAAAMAAVKITPEGKKALSESVELSEFYLQKQDPEHLKELDTTFHAEIYRACGSRILCRILSELHRNIKAYRKLSLTVPGRLEKSVEEHREIMDAIFRADADAAEWLTSAHVEHALKNLLSALPKD